MSTQNKVLVQHLKAPNNTNGNPRRAFAVYSMETGEILDVLDEGYLGRAAFTQKYPLYVELPPVDVSPKELKNFFVALEINRGPK